MKRPAMNEPQDLWEWDGSLRDVHLRDAAPSDWQTLLNIAATFPHEYSSDGDILTLPNAQQILENRDFTHLLKIWIGDAQIHCHFTDRDAIELDIDPREVVAQDTHDQVLAFLEQLATATRKHVSISAEGAPEFEYLSYDPSTQGWRARKSLQ